MEEMSLQSPVDDGSSSPSSSRSEDDRRKKKVDSLHKEFQKSSLTQGEVDVSGSTDGVITPENIIDMGKYDYNGVNIRFNFSLFIFSDYASLSEFSVTQLINGMKNAIFCIHCQYKN